MIYVPNIIRKLDRLVSCWQRLAVDSGFDGLTLVFQSAMSQHATGWNRSLFDGAVEFQPGFARYESPRYPSWFMNYSAVIKRFLGINGRLVPSEKFKTFSYDEVWRQILNTPPSSPNAIPSAFVDWDNTPRKGLRGSVCVGASPTQFEKYFDQLVEKTIEQYEGDKIFLFAWNEWAEGGYLEPDQRFGLGYLEAIKRVVDRYEV